MRLYGTGNNSFNSAGNCTYQDFAAYAARVDYAVAANLNVFASAMYAQRASGTGTPLGLYDGVTLQTRDRAIYPFRLPYITPNCPSSDLGWEIDAGLDWKILENVTVKMLFAWWKPGDWFRWAYQDRAHFPFDESTLLPTDLQINPGRTIDPITSIRAGFRMDF